MKISMTKWNTCITVQSVQSSRQRCPLGQRTSAVTASDTHCLQSRPRWKGDCRNVTRLTVEGKEVSEDTSAPLKKKLTLGISYKALKQKTYLNDTWKLEWDHFGLPSASRKHHTHDTGSPLPPIKSSASAVTQQLSSQEHIQLHDINMDHI